MKCKNCGFEMVDQTEYCLNCGAKLTTDTNEVAQVSNSFAAERLLPVFKDKLFLVLCGLMTITCVLSFALDSIPIINTLITIFLWITLASAQKGVVDKKQLRNVSGTVYATYILTYIGSILLIVSGALVALAYATRPSAFIVDMELESMLDGVRGAVSDSTIVTLVCTTLIVLGVILLLVNVFGLKKIHRFAKSVYQCNVDQNLAFIGMKSAKKWLVFFAVYGGFAAFATLLDGDVSATISNVCHAASSLIPVMLINKYFE